MKTAEWVCTVCGTTNRKLVPDNVTSDSDRCVTCHGIHLVEMGSRPVRWTAQPRSPLPQVSGK
jgi:hypothetical protein